jgi:hypothetical protein
MMAANRFDQASRYGAKLDAQGFYRWLLGDPTLLLQGWLDTRSLPFPGEPERTLDTVACLFAAAVPNEPWAVPLEFQLKPDSAMFGRLLEYLGRLWRERRPEGRHHRRYLVGAALVNLTGKRRTASRQMRFGQTAVMTNLGVAERNMAREDAAATLAAIAEGRVARCLLAFIPLMHGGGEAVIIQQWLALVRADLNSRLRGDYGGLALVFAELAGCHEAWRQALEGWNIMESKQVLEWMAQGEARGALRNCRKLLRLQLQDRFGKLPDPLVQRIEASEDLERLQAAVLQVPRLERLEDLKL